MNKQKLTLPTTKWGTLKSKYKPESNYVLNDEFTAGSENFITNNTGAIEKRPTDVQYNSTAFSGTPMDQFEAIFSSGVHHLLMVDAGVLKYTTGNGVINTVTSSFTPTASMEYSMYQNRVYMDNGIDNPQVYDITPAYGGVSYAVPHLKDMGCQVPGSAPTFAANSAGGSVPLGGHTYVVTFLYYGAEESNQSAASTLNTVTGSNQTVNLTNVPVGGYGVTARNIYRDNNDGVYLLVGTISNNTATTFTDSVSAGTTPVPVSQDLPPIFSYIALNLSRNWVAGVPGTPSVLYWSTPDFPDIFDPNNFIICNPRDPITGVCTFQGLTIVFNRHSFGKILGNSDDTFYYDEVPGTVGCVDNRSIQIRTIDGVPVLVWLSDRGLYKFDGSSVTYISDPIEDLVNFNLQQVSFTTGSNNQSTQADYQGGTSSPSIDLDSNPNTITVLNPKRVYQARADWEGGVSLTNIATADGTNQLKVPTIFAPTLTSGTLGGSATISGGNVVLPVGSDNDFSTSIAPRAFDGTFYYGVPLNLTGSGGVPTKYAQQLFIPSNGTITSLKTYQPAGDDSGSSFSADYTVDIYTDALGSPGVSLWSSGTFTKSVITGAYNSETFSPSLTVAAGTYWIVYTRTGAASSSTFPVNNAAVSDSHVGIPKCFSGGNWLAISGNAKSSLTWRANDFNTLQQVGPAPTSFPFDLTFTQTPVSASGTWQSPIFDSGSIGSAVSNVVTNSGSFPTSCAATLFIDASNDATMNTGVTTASFGNPSGSESVGISNLRYWRMRYNLSTTDNRRVPTLGTPSMTFTTTGTWISQPIDCTTDVTAYDAIQVTQNLPAGTTATITIATSTNNITYSSFTSVGSAVVRRWVKIKVFLTTTSDNVSTPSVSFLEFSWRQTSTFTSSIIDAGQIPTGWGVFQNASTLNGGTLTFYMRSASSSGGIPGATFQVVSNGVFPPAGVPPHEFAQWKIVFTSSADDLPTVSGVTVNWFIGTNQSPIRAASLFFNKTYYLSAATVGATTNNIVIAWDFENLWRVFTGVTIDALSLFFNEPFYCDPVRNNVYQWLIPATGAGSAISMDVRTKAFDLNDVNVLKNVRSLRVTGINTGTTIHAYYSVDRGATWIEMLNVDGTLGYVTTTSGTKFSQYFAADYSEDSIVSGSTIMFRVTSVDAFPCIIMGLEPVLYIRSGKYLEVPL